jgi:hypothetical protein
MELGIYTLTKAGKRRAKKLLADETQLTK